MKVLLGCVYAGTQKSYALSTFEKMCKFLPIEMDVLVVTDDPNLKVDLPTLHALAPGMIWATDIVYHGKEILRNIALRDGYDALIWQGIDCYYKDPHSDVNQLISAIESGEDIAGALVAGRNNYEYPVCREFKREDGKWLKDQIELPTEFFDGSAKRVYGYIGSDATILSRKALANVSMDGYMPWHIVKDNKYGLSALGPEEYWMWSAIERNGIIPSIDTNILPFHFHEDEWGAQLHGRKIRIEEMYA